jgi:AraC-like DNA-binding protein
MLFSMLVDLKLKPEYDGLLFLSDSTRNPPAVESHHHVELELNLVIKGTVTYVVGDRRYTFQPRTLLWLFPEQEHQLVDRSDDSQCYVAVFKPSLIERSCRTQMYEGLKEHTDHDGVVNTVLEPRVFDLIRKTLDSLMPGSLDADILNRECGFGHASMFCFKHADPDGLNAGLHHLLMLSWRSRVGGKVLGEAISLHPAVGRALKLLSEAQWEGNLSSLAKACGSSEAHLSRTFHRQVGVSLSRYRNTLRLSRFWDKYRGPEQTTMADAVYAAGFGSYSQFYKIFVQTYGHGPRASMANSSDRIV